MSFITDLNFNDDKNSRIKPHKKKACPHLTRFKEVLTSSLK